MSTPMVIIHIAIGTEHAPRAIWLAIISLVGCLNLASKGVVLPHFAKIDPETSSMLVSQMT
jgi:hypothetical protein